MNNKKITIMFILISFAILIGIGITFAYFTSSTDFENEFTTGLFQTEATETFTSPQNWLPGDTTPKELIITNTGNVDVKARVCITEEWESENGDTLPLEQNGNRAAIINLANTSDWTYRLGCYEYNDVLEPNDETSSFIESVTFNPDIEADLICTTNGNTKTCTSTGDGYDNATYTLTFTIETIQANAYDLLWPNPIQFVNRQNDNQISVGDEIRIDTEHFYVVSSDSNETVLLAKYNLLVGDISDYNNSPYQITLNKTLSSSDIGYGLQNSNARGWVPLEENENTSQYIGTVPFSGTNYWDNSVCEYKESAGEVDVLCSYATGLKNEYANASNIAGNTAYYSSPYPYVYRSNIGNNIEPSINYENGWGGAQNNGYTIAYYVENYVNTLKTLGALAIISGRLLSYEEAESLGCSYSSHWCSNVDSNNNPKDGTAPSWVYSTTYWLGASDSYMSLITIRSNGYFVGNDYCSNSSFGIRPVIEIPTSEIP